MVLRGFGSRYECKDFQMLIYETKNPPDCLVVLCRSNYEVLWNKVGFNGQWLNLGTSEECN